ncbi:MAG: AMP-binding protein [Lewinellaceae bacterium]|nr:AMP-binding protein [Saprospiraceae bacterium]MCB9337666.1 AMP-binding protein [Lewinellaceae bacterium]
MQVPNLLYQAAQRWPNNPAIHDEYGTMTYAELAALIKKTAEDLKALGIAPGLGVGVMGKNSRYFIAACFAVMDCGAVVMPVSNQMKADEVNDAVQTARLHAILDDQSSVAPFDHAAGRVKFPQQEWRLFFNPNADRQQPFAPHANNPALIRFTSGTTGTSKGVILSHEGIAERTEAANKVLQLGPDDAITWVLSMAYHFVVSIILYLRYGSAIVICDSFLADHIIEQTNLHEATLIYGSPMHIRLLASDQSGRQMPSLKRVVSTSTAISKAQCEAFLQRFGLPVSQAYGIIEVGLPIINVEKSEAFPDAVGYALPDYQVEMLDDDGHILPPGETGHLAMRGPGMLDAYLEPPRRREEILKNGWFYTGDLASKRPDGLIRIEGRKKSMINVSGNKVFPEEVEAVLNQHPAVQLCRVSSFMHRFLGECVQAEVVVKNGIERPDTEELLTFCRKRLSTYKIPQKVEFVESLPMTDSGKLLRR